MASSEYVPVDTSDLLEEKTAEDVGYKLVLVRGVPHNPLFDVAATEKLIGTFEARDSDVFVCTYVKAGTTWTQQIITNLIAGGMSRKKYAQVVPWLEALCATKILPEREATGWTMASVNSAPSPRYFKSHATVADLPRGKARPKVIVVARNPKDTIVSLYHHAKNKPEFGYSDGSFDAFLRVFLSGNAENGSWFKHVLEWKAVSLQDPERCLFLTYEAMKADQFAAVKQIADFIGVKADSNLVAATVKNSTMDAMKATNNIGMGHLRQGDTGRWRDTFTVAQSDLFDAVYKRQMAGTGLYFDFGQGLVM